VKGETVVVNGDRWTVVDVAPAQALAEMVAALLEDEGMVAMVRGAGMLSDMFSNLGASSTGTALVLVPEEDAGRALALIEETVTDYQGEELEAIMAAIAAGADPEALLSGAPEEDGPDGPSPGAPDGDDGGDGRG